LNFVEKQRKNCEFLKTFCSIQYSFQISVLTFSYQRVPKVQVHWGHYSSSSFHQDETRSLRMPEEMNNFVNNLVYQPTLGLPRFGVKNSAGETVKELFKHCSAGNYRGA
jgi:hypothetical protein